MARRGSGGGQVPLLQGDQEQREIALTSASSIVVVSLGLVGFIEYSLVMPVMAKYVVERLDGDEVFYGMSMAVFSAACVLTMPVFGFWADKRPMIEPFLCSVLLSMIGNAMYALAEFANSKWFVFFGRMMVGMGAANSTLTMSYITRSTNKDNRTKAIATVNGIGLLGIVLGPVLNVLINFDVNIGDLHFDPYTNPGWLMFILLGFIWFIMSFTFIEPSREIDVDDEIDHLLQLEAGDNTDGDGVAETWWTIWRRMFWKDSLWVFFVVSFVSNFLLSELETALPDLTTKSYGWNTVKNSLMYAVIGIVTASSLILTGIYSSVFSDRQFVSAGQIVYGIALIPACLTLDVEKPPYAWFVYCTLFLIIAAPLTDSPNMAAYSKRISSNPKAVPYMSLFLGFIDMSNGVSRTIAPLYAGWALVDETQRIRVYIGPTVMWGVSALSLLIGIQAYKTAEARARRFSSVRQVDGSAGPLLQSPMLVSTPNVVLHSALSELFTGPLPPNVNE